MQNEAIAEVFEEMADLLEIAGESVFRFKAYRNGAQAIRETSDSIKQQVIAGKDLTTIPGIGATLAEKAKVLVDKGTLPQLEQLREKYPPSLRRLLLIPGLGAKKVGTLYRELGVSDVEQLKLACEDNRVRKLKGFGEKTQTAILAGMTIATAANKRILRDHADDIVAIIRNYLLKSPSIQRIEFAGSYRRTKETVGDLDVLVVSDNPAEAMNHFCEGPMVRQVIVAGETKSSIRIDDSFQVDLRVVEEDSWGAALQYFTGSKEHNVQVRSLAKKRNLKINEYGVYPTLPSNAATETESMEETAKSIAGKTEAEVYAAIGMPWIPPEFREDRFEWKKDFVKFEQEVVQIADIRGDMHMHTTATDGQNTLEEMVRAAIAKGYQYIAITDHSKRVSIARGLDAERVLAQWESIDRLRLQDEFKSILILKGIECDILEDGELDLSDEVLGQSDWVMASVHFGQRQSQEQITDRIVGAIQHPSVTAISHPTGRLIGKREPYAVDLDRVYAAAREHKKLLEINSHCKRLDLNDLQAMSALAAGVSLVISTDAHSIEDFDLMKYGVQVARRAGAKRASIFNTKTRAEVETYLKLAKRK